MQSTTQQVRQVLVNELGLTRESVRGEAEKYIAQTIARMMGENIEILVSREVRRVLGEQIKTYSNQQGKFQAMIEENIRQAVMRQVHVKLNGSLAVTVQEKESSNEV